MPDQAKPGELARLLLLDLKERLGDAAATLIERWEVELLLAGYPVEKTDTDCHPIGDRNAFIVPTPGHLRENQSVAI
jgi:hypothetical protein